MKDINNQDLAVGDDVVFVRYGVLRRGRIGKINKQMVRVDFQYSLTSAGNSSVNIYPYSVAKLIEGDHKPIQGNAPLHNHVVVAEPPAPAPLVFKFMTDQD